MELITRRFLLRDFAEGDGPDFVAYHADPRTLSSRGREEPDAAEAGGLLERFRAWALERPRRNYQLAVVRLTEPQSLVGCCGLRTDGCGDGKAELGIELAPTFWGRHGYAIEIARALLDFGFRDLGLDEIGGVSTNANIRVARLATWFGAVAAETRPGPDWMLARGWSETEWRIAREAWARYATPERRKQPQASCAKARPREATGVL